MSNSFRGRVCETSRWQSTDFAKQFPPHVEPKVKNEFNVQSRLRILTELDNQIEILASSEAAHILVIFEG